MRLLAIIDRFEEDKAVLFFQDDNGEEIPVIWPKNCLPAAKEGDVLNISCEVDETATQKALAENESILRELLAKQRED